MGRKMLNPPQKGDLVYLPSQIMLIDNPSCKKWIKLDEPTLALMVEPQINKENIYHKVHVQGSDWLVRTIDALEVVPNAKS